MAALLFWSGFLVLDLKVNASAVPLALSNDKVASREGVFRGKARFSEPGGGRSGVRPDRSADFSQGPGLFAILDVAFINAATAANELTISLWLKLHRNNPAYLLFANSPSMDGNIGIMAFLSFPGNRIQLYASGCCKPTTQQLDETVANLPGFAGGDSWWTNQWHHFAFTKKLGKKQIWVDGILLKEGDNFGPIPTDLVDLTVGGRDSVGQGLDGMVDDFAIFNTALGAESLGRLSSGVSPSALPTSDKLEALWDFNDVPPGGQWLEVSPAPDEPDSRPDLIQITHVDGMIPWNAETTQLRIDGLPVVPTFTRQGGVVTLAYSLSPLLRASSFHTASVEYPEGTNRAVFEWSFQVGYHTRDSVNERFGLFRKGAGFTLDREGHTANISDFAASIAHTGAPWVFTDNVSFINDLALNDEMSVAFWLKKSEPSAATWITMSSARSPGLPGAFDINLVGNSIYYNTAGCCIGRSLSESLYRLSGFVVDPIGWNDRWHFFVFTKKQGSKKIWVDGELLAEQSDAVPLPTDITSLSMGSLNAGASKPTEEFIDDLAIYGTALDAESVSRLFQGSSPPDLPPTNRLRALWRFNDFPNEGVFKSIAPVPNSGRTAPTEIRVVHVNGATEWTSDTVSLEVDGVALTPVLVRDGKTVTVTGQIGTPLPSSSRHTARLTFPTSLGPSIRSWPFLVGPHIRDRVAGRGGVLEDSTQLSADGGGRTGVTGDRSALFPLGGKRGIYLTEGGFLSELARTDELTIAFWMNRLDITNSSAFYASSRSTVRGIQGHVPWSDNNLYFDTSGCCSTWNQRLSGSIEEYSGYSGDPSWWIGSWHFFVFTKKQSLKKIWIDGNLFLAGDSAAPLPPDMSDFSIGSWPDGNYPLHAMLDDFAIFGTALSGETIQRLYGGVRPDDLSVGDNLVAFWDFNSPISENTPPTIAVVADRTVTARAGDSSPGDIVTVRIGDAETTADNLVLSVSSSNPLLLPTSGLHLSGIGGVRTLELVPTVGTVGQATVGLTVDDGFLRTVRSFVLTVEPAPGAPTAISDSFLRRPGKRLRIAESDLLANDRKGLAGPLILRGVDIFSRNGGSLSRREGWITYTPPAGGDFTDAFTYTVTDGSLITRGVVELPLMAADSSASLNLIGAVVLGGGSVKLSLVGIPGRRYQIEIANRLINPAWAPLGSATADEAGRFEYIHLTPPPGAAFYRAVDPGGL